VTYFLRYMIYVGWTHVTSLEVRAKVVLQIVSI
jgi:hypothetical protein